MHRAAFAKLIGAILIGSAAVIPLATAAMASTPTTPGSYQGSASGDNLVVTVGGTKLTGGDSTVTDSSSPSSAAGTGSGQLAPDVVGSQSAVATADGSTQNLPQVCATPAVPSLPAPLGSLFTIGAACGSAQASVDPNGLPSSSATGSAGDIGVGVGNLLTQVVTAGSPLAGTLTTLFGSLPTLPVGGVDLSTLLTQLGVSAASTTSLLSVTAGSSTSSVTTDASSVTATSSASGSTIDLLQGAGAGGGPAVSISVGKAAATATFDRGTATATASVNPALVSVTVSSALTPAQTIAVPVGSSYTALAGTPLASTISVGSGTTTQSGASASADAVGVSVDLLTGVDGGIDADFSSGTASVAGVAAAAPVAAATTTTTTPAAVTEATTPVTPTPAVVPDVTAVHTGEPWAGSLPLALGAFVLGLVLLGRRRLASLIGSLAHHGAGTGRNGPG